MLAEERQQAILHMLKNNHIVSVQDICHKTKSSESSIRRDLQLLEENGMLERVHGGARMIQNLQHEPDMVGKTTQHPQEKQAIAQCAASHVRPNDVIFLDAGTTTLAMIDFLVDIPHIKVVTNGVLHAYTLSDRNIETFMVGGKLKTNTKALVGTQALNELAHMHFNKAFLGANALSITEGYMTPDPEEAAVKALALQQADKGFVCADASKLDQVSFIQIAPLKAATLISNSCKTIAQYREKTEVKEVKI